MKKLIISGGIAAITIPCLCYYIAKYYIYKSLTFEQSMIIVFTFICSLIIFAILSNVYNSYQIFMLKKQNSILHDEIKELKDIIENYHYDNLEYHEHNREILLDLDNKGGK